MLCSIQDCLKLGALQSSLLIAFEPQFIWLDRCLPLPDKTDAARSERIDSAVNFGWKVLVKNQETPRPLNVKSWSFSSIPDCEQNSNRIICPQWFSQTKSLWNKIGTLTNINLLASEIYCIPVGLVGFEIGAPLEKGYCSIAKNNPERNFLPKDGAVLIIAIVLLVGGTLTSFYPFDHLYGRWFAVLLCLMAGVSISCGTGLLLNGIKNLVEIIL